MIIAPRPEWLYAVPTPPQHWTWSTIGFVIALNLILVAYSVDTARIHGNVLRWVALPVLTAVLATCALVVDVLYRPTWVTGALLLVCTGTWIVHAQALRRARLREHRELIADGLRIVDKPGHPRGAA